MIFPSMKCLWHRSRCHTVSSPEVLHCTHVCQCEHMAPQHVSIQAWREGVLSYHNIKSKRRFCTPPSRPEHLRRHVEAMDHMPHPCREPPGHPPASTRTKLCMRQTAIHSLGTLLAHEHLVGPVHKQGAPPALLFAGIPAQYTCHSSMRRIAWQQTLRYGTTIRPTPTICCVWQSLYHHGALCQRSSGSCRFGVATALAQPRVCTPLIVLTRSMAMPAFRPLASPRCGCHECEAFWPLYLSGARRSAGRLWELWRRRMCTRTCHSGAGSVQHSWLRTA